MSLRLTDFGTFDEVNDVSYFKFAISKFSKIGENKISRAFRHAGQIWKLQVRKINGFLGMFLRWYGTKIGQESLIKCYCKTGLEFSVVNQFDSRKTVREGNLLDDDIYDRPRSGIGYGEVIQLLYLENIPGYLISDTLIAQVKLKIKATTFIDKIQVLPRPERIFIRGLNFSFYGAEWSLILFPKGERPDDDYDDEDVSEAVREKETNKSTLYLSREKVANNNRHLRHRVRFQLFVDGGPSFEIEQNFHEKQSQVFGTGYLMSAKELQKLGSSGVIRVGVTFLEIQPYFNYAYDLQDAGFPGIKLTDQRNIPWLLIIGAKKDDDDDMNEISSLSYTMQIDPECQCKQIKALMTRDKKLKTIWHLRVINFQDAEMNVDVWSEQDANDTNTGVYKYAGETHRMPLPIKRNQVNSNNSPYLDDDGQSCVQLSVLNSNFVSHAGEVAMKIDDIAAIAVYHKNKSNEKERDHEIREQIWQISLSNLEEEKNEILNNSREALDKQESELQDKTIMINSLQEKLTAVEGYVQSLESNSLEDIDKFNQTSISKLIEKSRPDVTNTYNMGVLFKWIEEHLKNSSNDVVSVIPSGAFGEGTLTNTKRELDIVIFLKGELEDSLVNGNMAPSLEFIQRTLESNAGNNNNTKNDEANNKNNNHEFSEFLQTPISLRSKCDDIDVVIYPTKNWGFDRYHVIYEASTGLTRDSLKCFITATSERRSAFIKNQKEECRDLIRIMKSWRDRVKWEAPQNRPNSYLLSLLTIQAYTTLKGMSIAKTPAFPKEVIHKIGILCSDEDLRIEWSDYYDLSKYEIKCTNAPLVRDPVLPAHNVAETGIGSWTQLREELSVWGASLCH